MNYPSFVFAIFCIAQLVHNAKANTCEVKVKRIGCFNDKSRPLNKLLVYRRTQYNHEEQKIALPRLLCDCAVEARLQGYNYIGLQFYAECWSSSEAEPHYSRDGASTSKCFNAEFQPCSQDDTECVGGVRAYFVYKIANPDETSTEMTRTPSTSTQEILQTEATTEPSTSSVQSSLPSPSVPSTFQVTEPSKQPSSTPSEPTIQITERPSEQTEPSTSSVETSEVTELTTPPSEPTPPPSEPTTPPSEPTLQKTEELPSTAAPVASTPCQDKLTNCADYESYCSDKYPYMLEQCPKFCQRCE